MLNTTVMQRTTLVALLSGILGCCASDPIANAIFETAITAMVADATKQNPAIYSAQKPTAVTSQKPVALATTTIKTQSNPTIVYYRDTPEYAQELAKRQQALAQVGIGSSSGSIMLDMLNDLQKQGNIPVNQISAYQNNQNAEHLSKLSQSANNLAKQEQFWSGIDASNKMQKSAIAGMRKNNNYKAENYTVGGVFSKDVNWNLEKAGNAARYGKYGEAQEWYNTAIHANKLNQITR